MTVITQYPGKVVEPGADLRQPAVSTVVSDVLGAWPRGCTREGQADWRPRVDHNLGPGRRVSGMDATKLRSGDPPRSIRLGSFVARAVCHVRPIHPRQPAARRPDRIRPRPAKSSCRDLLDALAEWSTRAKPPGDPPPAGVDPGARRSRSNRRVPVLRRDRTMGLPRFGRGTGGTRGPGPSPHRSVRGAIRVDHLSLSP